MTQNWPGPEPEFVHRTLAAALQQYAGIASFFTAAASAPGRNLEDLRQPAVDAYRRLFTPPDIPAAATGDGDAFLRVQRAAEEFAKHGQVIATDAWERLARALAESGPEAAPITSLAAFHALWIDCGEAAYARAAHREEFAQALAELLTALVELRAAATPR